MRRSIPRVSVAAAAFAAASAVIVGVAPHALAEVSAVDVASGPSGPVTGCEYNVTATLTTPATEPGSVTFWNSGDQIPGLGDFPPRTTP